MQLNLRTQRKQLNGYIKQRFLATYELSNACEAVKWYIKASEGGYVRSMYYTSLCYQWGEGVAPNYRQAKRWMKRAADHGHSKAQYKHALCLLAEKETTMAVVYLELATRAGQTAAGHLNTALFQQMPASSWKERFNLLTIGVLCLQCNKSSLVW